MNSFSSILIWIGIVLLILIWIPVLAISRVFDRDPALYHTGKLFRKLGHVISKINPNWKIEIEGNTDINDREPFIIVSNHMSNADIPLISNLPWEMKWVAKKELFDVPVIGWLMKLAGDISVDREAKDRRAVTLKRCIYYLDRNCSVIFFPEGTRSRDGNLNRFTNGAFDLAIRKNIDVLPLAIDGTKDCLPKKSWKFKPGVHVRLKVLEPVSSRGYSKKQAAEFSEYVRMKIRNQLAEWRNEPVESVDNTLTRLKEK